MFEEICIELFKYFFLESFTEPSEELFEYFFEELSKELSQGFSKEFSKELSEESTTGFLEGMPWRSFSGNLHWILKRFLKEIAKGLHKKHNP